MPCGGRLVPGDRPELTGIGHPFEGVGASINEGDPRALDKVDDGVGHQDLTRRRKRHRGRDRAHGESNLLRHGQQNLEHSGRAPPAILPEQVPRLRKAREENLQVGDTWHVEGNLTGLEAAAGLPPTPSSPSHTYDGEPFGATPGPSTSWLYLAMPLVLS